MNEHTRFHRKFKSLKMPTLERKDDGAIIDLSDMQAWRATHGGWAFTISCDPEHPEGGGKFSISIRPLSDLTMDAVSEFEQYTSLTAAKDACFDHYERLSREKAPKLTRSEALPEPGEKGVTFVIITNK